MTAEDVLYDAQVYADDDLNEADIVEWYETRPVTVPTAVATGAMIGAFALGVLTAVGAVPFFLLLLRSAHGRRL